MGAAKELWFAAMERRFNELVDSGMAEDDAYEAASEQAHDRMIDALADQADNLRKKAKGE